MNRMIMVMKPNMSVYLINSPRSCPAGGFLNRCRPLSEIITSSSAMINIEVAKTGTGSSTKAGLQVGISLAGGVESALGHQ